MPRQYRTGFRDEMVGRMRVGGRRYSVWVTGLAARGHATVLSLTRIHVK